MPLSPSLCVSTLLAIAPAGTPAPAPTDTITTTDTETAAAQPEPRRPFWDDSGPYLSLGLAPFASMNNQAFHPGVRYDIESGVALSRRRAMLWVGADFHLMQFHGKPRPGWGVDVVATLSGRHVYGRVGAGTAMGIPGGADVRDVRPMVGGQLGAGLVGRFDGIEGRLGLDLDTRIDTTGRVSNTLMLALRINFGP
ncbi:MAG: hypothetical protein AAF799_05015 [Myxococcota bacterium]